MIRNGIYRDYLKDIKEFERLYTKFIEGEVFESDFKNFRLVNGIYGQRQKDYFMVRIKVPSGILTPQQLKKIATIGEKYSNGVAHFTTRQDIQFHWVKLENIPHVLKETNEAGLTTKDACGNTLRNITASYLSGVCPSEIIEVQRIALKVSESLIGKYDNLPRKFKIGFSCCDQHSYLIPFNDLGFIPALKEGKPGFSVYMGGGLGDRPKYAFKYTDFLPFEELLLLIESVLRVFNDYGDRKNRRHNRLKFLIEKLGREKFLKILDRYIQEGRRDYTPFECDAPIELPSKKSKKIPYSQKQDYRLWLETNVIPQKQENMYTVLIKLHLGNITTGKLKKIGEIADEYTLSIKATQDQNIALLNVPEDVLFTLYRELDESGLASVGASTYLDITACPGSETCSLGITGSRDLARAIYERLPSDPESIKKFKNLTIKVSGCPNGCAHHHVASIGLHGIAIKIDDTLIPAYVIHLGGNGNITKQRIGITGIKIPAKNVPDAVAFLLEYYRENSHENEEFNDFIDRITPEKIFQLLEPFKKLYREDTQYSMDWGSDKQFSLEDIGTGECAGIIADRVEEALKESERLLQQAKTHIKNGIPEDAQLHIDTALDIICSGLLIPFGVKAEGSQAREKFIEQVIGRKIVDESFIPLLTEKINDPKYRLGISEKFYDSCKKAYLKLRKETEQKKEKAKQEEKGRKEFLDLKGIECPFNYVKAKYKLREMDTGSILVITLDGEESIKSVPQSLRDDGHEIINIQEEGDGVYTLIVRKR